MREERERMNKGKIDLPIKKKDGAALVLPAVHKGEWSQMEREQNEYSRRDLNGKRKI